MKHFWIIQEPSLGHAEQVLVFGNLIKTNKNNKIKSEPGRVRRRWESEACDRLERIARERFLKLFGRAPAFKSRSHSFGWGAVLLSGRSATLRGIGVDLEAYNRKISPLAYRRVTDPGERRLGKKFGLRPIEVWCLKEAVFKAGPRGEFKLIGDTDIGDRHLELQVFRVGRWVLAVALRLNKANRANMLA